MTSSSNAEFLRVLPDLLAMVIIGGAAVLVLLRFAALRQLAGSKVPFFLFIGLLMLGGIPLVDFVAWIAGWQLLPPAESPWMHLNAIMLVILVGLSAIAVGLVHFMTRVFPKTEHFPNAEDQYGELGGEEDARFREIFEESPVSLLIQDWSAVKRLMAGWSANGVSDFSTFFDEYPEKRRELCAAAKLLHTSRAALKLYRASCEEDYLAATHRAPLDADELRQYCQLVVTFFEGARSGEFQARDFAVDGTPIVIRFHAVIAPARLDDWARVLISVDDVTEKAVADAALAANEERFRDVAELSVDWLWEMDANLVFTYVSEGHERATGIPAKNVLGKTRVELSEGAAANKAWSAHREDLAARRPFYDFQYAQTRDSGQVHYYATSGKPLYADDGRFLGYRGMGKDISKTKRADLALRESEDRYRRLVEVSPDGIFINFEGRLVYANPAAQKAFGAENLDQLMDVPVRDLVHPDFHDAMKKRVTATTRTVKIQARMDQVYVGLDGREFDVETTATPIQYQSRPATLSVFRDISERKQFERALQESEAQKIRAESRLTEAIETLSEGFIWCDADDRIILSNKKIGELYSLSADFIKPGVPFAEVLRAGVAVGQFADAIGHEEEFLKERLASHRDPQGPFHQQLGDGRWLQVSERRLPDGGIVGIRTDITWLKEMEAELRRKERFATLGQLTATVSHELRNPLGAMRTSTHVLRRKLDLSEGPMLRALERLDRSISRCDLIIDELLDYTRISELEPRKLSLDSWLGDLLDELDLPPEIAIEREFMLKDLVVAFDPDRLRRAVINLYDNACQAITTAGQLSGCIRILTQCSDNRIEISIEDDGPGIPDHIMANIFEPLFSTKSFGVGLGLSIVKRIVEQHRGGVEITSLPGRGTAFTLWLPRDKDEQLTKNPAPLEVKVELK